MKDNNYIISPYDSRYGKLGHIYKKYDYYNIRRGCDREMEYFIPPELVLQDEVYKGGYRVLSKLDANDDDYCNWISRSVLSSRLNYHCDLSVEEFFNLVVLHNNSLIDIPRCSYCKSKLQFSGRFVRGYNSSAAWDYSDTHFCNHSCADNYLWSEEGRAKWNYHTNNLVKLVYGRELVRDSPYSECHLYLVIDITNKVCKFGLTSDFERRSKFVGDGKILLTSTRLEIANIEARLKLDNYGIETFSIDRLDWFYNKLNKILETRPVTSPFE